MRLNISQAAGAANTSRMTIHRLIRSGKVRLYRGGLVDVAQLDKALQVGRSKRPVRYKLNALPEKKRIMGLLISAALSDRADFDFVAYAVRLVVEGDFMFIGHLLNPPAEVDTFARWVAWRVHQLAKDSPTMPTMPPTWSRVVALLMALPFRAHLAIEYRAWENRAVLKSMPTWLDEKPDIIRRVPLDSSRGSFIPTKARALQDRLNALWSEICGGSLPAHKAEYADALGGLINGNLSVAKASKTLGEISGLRVDRVQGALRPFIAERDRYLARSVVYNDEAPPESVGFDYDEIDRAVFGHVEANATSRRIKVRSVPVAVTAAALGVSRLTIRRWVGR